MVLRCLLPFEDERPLTNCSHFCIVGGHLGDSLLSSVCHCSRILSSQLVIQSEFVPVAKAKRHQH